jgi:UDP-glucose 4-epimerase
VFSSTAAIFGNPVTEKIAEDHPKSPINPYGQSKLVVENILKDYCNAYDLNATCFRYFNAAGADSSGEIGEAHNPETHLIPNILKSVLSGRSELKVFGADYPTPDGTCVRDYVHVNDLAQAHLLGLEYMQNNKGFSAFNLGNGDGFSVLDVIKACEQVVCESIEYKVSARRDGDPAVLVADSSKAFTNLGWLASYRDPSCIIKSAWGWHKNFEEAKA